MEEDKTRSAASHVFAKLTLLNYVNLLIKSKDDYQRDVKKIRRLCYRTHFCFSFLTFYVTYAATVSTAS